MRNKDKDRDKDWKVSPLTCMRWQFDLRRWHTTTVTSRLVTRLGVTRFFAGVRKILTRSGQGSRLGAR